MGVLNSALPFSLMAYASNYLPAGYLAIVNSFVPTCSAILSYFFLKQKITLTLVLGLLAGSTGVSIVVGFGPVNLNMTSILALFCGLLAAFCYALSGVLTVMFFSNSSNIKISFLSLSFASIVLLPFLFLDFNEIKSANTVSWFSVLILGFLCTGLAYLVYFRLLKLLGPTVSSSVTFSVPVFGVLWGTVFLNEVFTVAMGVGCFLVLLASFLVFKNKK